MRSRRRSAVTAMGKRLGESLLWMGFAWTGVCPPHAWTDDAIPPAELPCLPPYLPEDELARWTALVRYL
ncbi:hypothetical protein [Streptomyces sp. GC420]|uniref:hypothetical protein n=1 Tax=Streptomyces sp. GC420 TaxID=2697568 RepID=UPI0014151CFD|nr:hypothetical protein [Streptomyces sp. GC420]NBM14413.1 hypothetical protein [Streptomyces sp. GC420]